MSLAAVGCHAADAANEAGLDCPGAAAYEQIAEVTPLADVVIPLRPGRGDWLVETDELGVDVDLVLRDADGRELAVAAAVPERAAWQFFVASADRTRTSLSIGLRPSPYSPRPGRVRLRLSCLDAQPPERRRSLEILSDASIDLAQGERDGIDAAHRLQSRLAALKRLEDLLPALRETPLRAWAEHNAGFLLRRIGRMRDALPHLERAAAYWRQAGQADRAIWADYQAAMTLIALADYDKARSTLNGVITAARRIGDVHLEGNAYNDACLVRRYKGDYGAASDCYEQAMRILAAAGELASFTNAAINRAQVEKLRGHVERAREAIDEACRRLEATAAPTGERMRCAWARAMLDLDQEHMDRALTGLDEALKLAVDGGDAWWEGTLLLNLADARRLNGEDAAAEALLARAAEHFGASDLPERAAAAWLALARIEYDTGKRDEHAKHVSLALDQYAKIGSKADVARLRVEQARAALAERDVERAKRSLAEYDGLMPAAVPSATSAEYALALAELAVAEGRPSDAIRIVTQQLPVLERSSLRLGFQARCALARAKADTGAQAEALAVLDAGLGRARNVADRIGHPLLRRALAGEARKLLELYLSIALGDGSGSSGAAISSSLARIEAVRAIVWDGFKETAFQLPSQAAARREYLLQWLNRTAAERVLSNATQASVPGMPAPRDIDAALLELDAIESRSSATGKRASTSSAAGILASSKALPDDAVLVYFIGAGRGYRFTLLAGEIRLEMIPGENALSLPIASMRESVVSSATSLARLNNDAATLASMLWPRLP
ncbi:MAG TPA: tetratricopeptide repeat protein, partial [Rhodanobacteraceae bacterium]|nr:tetratricopeptide repeat protein [Rhodanobacteraceae bacterium]